MLGTRRADRRHALTRACVALGVALVAGCAKTDAKPPAVPISATPTPPPSASVEAKPEESPASNVVSELDPAVRSGVLPNGLTYFVMRREEPVGRAALWLAVDAGSVLEDDDQRGLAHFVEHMAFNGTAHYPKRALLDFFERAGMRVGADVNAYTAFDQTVYTFTLPTDREELVSRGLDVLHEIAGGVTFEPAEVDGERPVILEEWRMRRGAHARTDDEKNPLLFAGSRYAEREPIGLPETIRTAPVAALKRFYADWYRPSLMGVIAVGDFDPSAVEQTIRQRFADLRNPEKPRPRPTFARPTSARTQVAVHVDAELPTPEVTLFDRTPRRVRATRESLRAELVDQLFMRILRQRLAELTETPSSVLLHTSVGRTRLARPLDAFTYSFVPRAGKLENALFVVLDEFVRLGRYGVLPEELDRSRKELRVAWEGMIEDEDRAPLNRKASELVRHLFENEEVLGSKGELDVLHEILPAITLDEVNRVARERARGSERLVSIALPPSRSPPPTQTLVNILETAAQRSLVGPWQTSTPKGPLIATPPAAGTIVKRRHDAGSDADVWLLSNGVRVIVKPTSLSSGTVLLRGFQPGGTSLVSEADFLNARFASSVVGADGAGAFGSRDLHALLAGSGAELEIGLNELEQVVGGKAPTTELTTLFQYLYLRLTRPRADEFPSGGWRRQRTSGLYRHEDAPDENFKAEVLRAATGDHWRRRAVARNTLNQVDGPRALAIWQRLFSNFRGFTFVLVGRFDPAELEPLVTTYLGSLPSRSTPPRFKDPHISYPPGVVERTVRGGIEEKARFWLEFAGPLVYRAGSEDDAQILSDVLELRLRDVLREQLGGVYVVAAQASVTREPSPRRQLVVQFTCAPENTERLQRAVFEELSNIAQNGVDDDMLGVVRQRLARQDQANRRNDGWWLARLADAYHYADDFGKSNDLALKLARVTRENVRRSAALMFDPHHYVRVIMLPEVTPPAPAAVTASLSAPTTSTDVRHRPR
jgi:zinc protease